MPTTLSKTSFPATTVLCKTITTTLATLIQEIGNIPMDIENEISDKNLTPAGPSIFVYTNCTNDPNTPFELNICSPIEPSANYSGAFNIIQLPEFPCIQTTYEGNMDTLGSKGWEPFMGTIMKDKTTITNEMREVYTQWVSLESRENIIELQVGLA